MQHIYFMKKLILSALVCTVILSHSNSQVPARPFQIKFRVIAPSLPDDSSIFICGSIPQLASWDPGKLRMIPEGNHKWSYTIVSETAFPVEYKYTLGSWDREGTNSKGDPLPNFIIKVRCDTTITDTVKGWLNRGPHVIRGQITGSVRYHKQLNGKGIPARDLIVWLPPGYEIDKNRRYPVIYMHDGQNLFDPSTSSFGVDWKMDETCDSLIRNRIICPVIIAGIYNSANRMTEYTPGNTGEDYMDFIVKIVKPLIDSTYRTMPGRRYSFVGGSSAGGTISFMLVWRYSEIFSKAFCLSPAFKIQNIDVVKDISGYSGRKKKVEFYIDNGGVGLEERLQPGVDEMVKTLELKGYRRGKDLFLVREPQAQHNETAWAKRMPEALKMMLK
jgi:predicted alpha/beta superfamily hydrolase